MSRTKMLVLRMFSILALVLVLSVCVPARTESYEANTMRLLRQEGQVEIYDPSGQSRFVMENVRFASGETMQTGEDGIASVGLDDTKIVTLDTPLARRASKSVSAKTPAA